MSLELYNNIIHIVIMIIVVFRQQGTSQMHHQDLLYPPVIQLPRSEDWEFGQMLGPREVVVK